MGVMQNTKTRLRVPLGAARLQVVAPPPRDCLTRLPHLSLEATEVRHSLGGGACMAAFVTFLLENQKARWFLFARNNVATGLSRIHLCFRFRELERQALGIFQ